MGNLKMGRMAVMSLMLLVGVVFADRAMAQTARGTTRKDATQLTTTGNASTTNKNTTTTTNTTTTSTTGGSGYGSTSRVSPTPTPGPSPTPINSNYGGGNSNMNEGAKSAKGMQMVGVGLNAAAAAMFFAQCSSCRACWHYCAMGMASLAQAASMLGSAGGAGNTANATEFNPNIPGYTGPTYEWDRDGDGQPDVDTDGDGQPDNPITTTTTLDPKVEAERKKIAALTDAYKKAGYEISKDGERVKLPDGRQVPMSALGSLGGMKSLGMTDQQIGELNAAQKAVAAKLNDKLKALTIDMDGGGGGGGSSYGGGGGRRGGGGGDFSSLFGDKEKRKAASVSGLSKAYGDSRIGVPQDNIFEMVGRQYVKQEGKQSFLPTAGGK